MTPTTDAAAAIAGDVAGKLTKAQRKGLDIFGWGFPAGHNAWPEMEYLEVPGDPDSAVICEGEDIDFLLRHNLLEAVEDGEPTPCVFEMGDARWTIQPTPLGLLVKAHLSEQGATAGVVGGKER
jgi:hypothetical protein